MINIYEPISDASVEGPTSVSTFDSLGYLSDQAYCTQKGRSHDERVKTSLHIKGANYIDVVNGRGATPWFGENLCISSS